MGDNFQYFNAGGELFAQGELADPGATPGDVLTVQDDGSIAAEAGDGSLPDGWTVNDPASGILNANGGGLVLGGGGLDLGGGNITSVADVDTATVHSNPNPSGALPTGTYVSGTANVLQGSDGTIFVPFTTDATLNDATLQVEISPDGTTFSTVGTYFVAAAINTVGAVTLIAALPIPGGWHVRLTAAHCTIGTATFTGTGD